MLIGDINSPSVSDDILNSGRFAADSAVNSKTHTRTQSQEQNKLGSLSDQKIDLNEPEGEIHSDIKKPSEQLKPETGLRRSGNSTDLRVL